MTTLNDIPFDNNGYLKNFDDWSTEIAKEIAKKEGISLTQEHWIIVNKIRDFYAEYQLSPPVRFLVKTLQNEIGPEKGNSLYLRKLFPPNPAQQAIKISGLPKPTRCI